MLLLETIAARLDRMNAAQLVSIYAATGDPVETDYNTDNAIYDALRAINPRAYRTWEDSCCHDYDPTPEGIAAADAHDLQALRAAYGITA